MLSGPYINFSFTFLLWFNIGKNNKNKFQNKKKIPLFTRNICAFSVYDKSSKCPKTAPKVPKQPIFWNFLGTFAHILELLVFFAYSYAEKVHAFSFLFPF